MAFGGMNYLAILVAAVAAFAFGAVWYMSLSKPWLAALGKTPQEIKSMTGQRPMTPFIVSAISLVVMAWVIAGLMGHLGVGQVTVKNGIISGAFVWLGIALTVLNVTQRFEGQTWQLTFIDAGHWLGVLVIIGAVIGAFGV